LSKAGCEVELGVELRHLEQFDDHVKVSLLRHDLDGSMGVEPVQEEGSYEWVIGSDGAKGAVRKELGLHLLGETTAVNFITGDFRVEGLGSDVNLSVFDLSSANLTFYQRWHMWGDMAETLYDYRSKSRSLSLI
jgi:flavin-dependent dehydrogenase